MKIDFKSQDYLENISYLTLINDLYTGTKKVKSNPEKYLFKNIGEEDEEYQVRLIRSNFENYIKPAVDNINALVYRKDIKLNYKTKFKKLFENIDGEGSSFKSFAYSHSKNAIKDGMSFIWVDAPFIDKKLTKYDVSKQSIFPYFKSLKRSQLLNYSTKIINGKKILSQVVLSQKSIKEVNDFETEIVEQFVVLRIGSGAIFEKEGEKFILVKQWSNNLTYVPFFATYSSKESFLKADIPFLDLSEMNLKLYNLMSDDSNIRHLVSSPVKQIFGYTPELDENGNEITLRIGINNALRFQDKQTQGFEYSSPDAAAINANENSIKELKDAIEKFSFSLLSKTSYRTATEAEIHDKNSSLFLVELVESLESTFIQAFKTVEDYLEDNIDLELEFNRDFNDTKLSSDMITKLLELKNNGIISLDTIWDALIKGEVIDLFDYEEEKKKIKEELSEVDLTGYIVD